jgi:phi13 family phage major tail protein
MTLNRNDGEQRVSIGLDSVWFAKVTQDDADGYITDTPQFLAPVAELTGDINTSEAIMYFDNLALEQLMAEGETVREFDLQGMAPELEALLSGDNFNAADGSYTDRSDPTLAPYFAVGYRSKKSNGSYRYFWFYKGKFAKPKKDEKSQSDSADAMTTKLTYTAVKTRYQFTQANSVTDGAKRFYKDEDTSNVSVTGWFSAVQTPDATAPSAIALSSSVPADEATGIAVGDNITLTFNNPIKSGAIYGVTLLDDTPELVPLAASLSGSRLVITLDPTSDLDAATVYQIVVAGVTDIYDQVLATERINFTTS